MIIGINHKSTIIPREMSSQINRRVTRSMTKVATQDPSITKVKVATQKPSITKNTSKQVSSQTQVAPTTGVEFLTYEECKKRGLTNDIYNKRGTMVVGYFVYIRQEKIHPMYLENLSPEQLSNPNLLAVAPYGFLWTEEPSCTSYYSWDEYYILVENPYI